MVVRKRALLARVVEFLKKEDGRVGRVRRHAGAHYRRACGIRRWGTSTNQTFSQVGSSLKATSS